MRGEEIRRQTGELGEGVIALLRHPGFVGLEGGVLVDEASDPLLQAGIFLAELGAPILRAVCGRNESLGGGRGFLHVLFLDRAVLFPTLDFVVLLAVFLLQIGDPALESGLIRRWKRLWLRHCCWWCVSPVVSGGGIPLTLQSPLLVAKSDCTTLAERGCRPFCTSNKCVEMRRSRHAPHRRHRRAGPPFDDTS